MPPLLIGLVSSYRPRMRSPCVGTACWPPWCCGRRSAGVLTGIQPHSGMLCPCFRPFGRPDSAAAGDRPGGACSPYRDPRALLAERAGVVSRRDELPTARRRAPPEDRRRREDHPAHLPRLPARVGGREAVGAD